MRAYAYIRVSTDRQNIENQKYEILKFADEKKIRVTEWIQETVSGVKKAEERKLGVLLRHMKSGDALIATEISRLGRNIMEIMTILHDCMEREIKIFTTKERYELGNNVNSKVLAFAFGLSAEIERNMISQRTKEALALRKSQGVKLGRPKGTFAKKVKLSGREKEIKMFLARKMSVSAIGRIYDVHRVTVANFIKSRKLNESS